MDLRKTLLKPGNQVEKILKRQIGMQAVDDVDLRQRLVRALPESSLVVDASGKYLYITALNSGNNVYGFVIDGTSGVPTAQVSGSPVPAGSGAAFIVNDTSGQLVFVGNQTSNSLSGFKIDAATGVLTLISTTTTGSAPTSMVFLK